MTSSPRETELCRYHYDPLDRLVSHALADIPGRQRFYCKSRLLATDQQRSVLQMVNANHPPQPIVYSPYGHRPVESGLLSLLGFNGERPDPVTGCYLLGNGYRALNPVLMRFNSPDSLSPFGKGGLNTYAYCAGDPINWTDPTGHSIIANLVKSSGNRLSTKTLTALHETKKALGGGSVIKSDARNFQITPEQFLAERTINNNLTKVEKNLSQFENPQFTIHHKEQVEILDQTTRKKVNKHMDLIIELNSIESFKSSQGTQLAIVNTNEKIKKFLKVDRERLTNLRLDQLKNEGIINYATANKDIRR
ncbi:RHS repeat-associated core domain-containing protein [Pseudomonas sp. NPDC087336]|uniref:RHS repeat-associated core domain-containing protein n=1 Tax=Pseudomonas sp. NPDC087336 TaxID=3364436 RepID=UPI00380AD034